MNAQAPPNWYPDPFGRFEFRYWDGTQWTLHVASHGRQSTDPPVSPPAPRAHHDQLAQPRSRASKKIQRQVRRAGIVPTVQQGDQPGTQPTPQPMVQAGGAAPANVGPAAQSLPPGWRQSGAAAPPGPLFSEPVLVVNQKARLVAANAEYAIFNQHGQQIGAVREIGQSLIRNAVVGKRRGRSHRLLIVDHADQVVLTLSRGDTFAKSKLIVRRPDGTEVGQIPQKTLGIFGKVRFDLESRGEVVGSIQAENWSVWNFSIQDRLGDEVAHISKSGRGQTSSRSMKRDQYIVEFHRQLDDPMHSLVTAAALAIDIALREQ